MENIKDYWEQKEISNNHPLYLNNYISIDSSEFYSKLENNKEAYKLIDELYSGSFYLIKNAIDKNFLDNLKEKLISYSNSVPSSFHKMLEGCPNFHREIDEQKSLNYSVKAVRHSYYFFRWNDDTFNLFTNTDKIWSSIKLLGGLNPESFVKNTPQDGIVDRIQVVRYPANTGFIEPHQHDPINQRLIISIYMSKKNVDYLEGGTYFFDNEDNKVEVEDDIDPGDVGIFYGSLKHAVSPVKLKNTISENNNGGRWWIGLYSPETDYIKNRHTSNPVK